MEEHYGGISVSYLDNVIIILSQTSLLQQSFSLITIILFVRARRWLSGQPVMAACTHCDIYILDHITPQSTGQVQGCCGERWSSKTKAWIWPDCCQQTQQPGEASCRWEGSGVPEISQQSQRYLLKVKNHWQISWWWSTLILKYVTGTVQGEGLEGRL